MVKNINELKSDKKIKVLKGKKRKEKYEETVSCNWIRNFWNECC
jgi:hypothetical protein